MKRVLFCVLNWGLGHATRSTPIIAFLLELGCEVRLASDGLALTYLENKFPNLHITVLSDYKVKYPTSSAILNIASSLRSIQHAIQYEKDAINKIAEVWHPDVIISDNRYGCHHPDALNVLISHQLRPIAPNALSQAIVDRVIKRKLTPFDQLWVPDKSPPNNFTGTMSGLDDNRVTYVGHLSALPERKDHLIPNRLLILLSGPEPARTKFEQRILNLELEEIFSCELIRGTDTPRAKISAKYLITNLADENTVAKAIASAEYIICRSGYSTIMDLLVHGKKALFVPTPGQPEQEYLAQMAIRYGFGLHLSEKDITREVLLQTFKQLDMISPFEQSSNMDFKPAIQSILN